MKLYIQCKMSSKASHSAFISRNRFIVQACEQALNNYAGQWSKDFFDRGLSGEQVKLLKEGVTEMEEAIINMRRNRMTLASYLT